ncbi:MAG: GAF domain-containing protein [Myxococcota bacterium]
MELLARVMEAARPRRRVEDGNVRARSERVLEMYRELVGIVSAGDAVETAALAAARWSRNLTSADGALVTRASGDDSLLVLAAVGLSRNEPTSRVGKGDRYLRQALAGGETIYFGEAPKHEKATSLLPAPRNGVVVPIANGQLLGTLEVNTRRSHPFRADDIALLREIASILALGLRG